MPTESGGKVEGMTRLEEMTKDLYVSGLEEREVAVKIVRRGYDEKLVDGVDAIDFEEAEAWIAAEDPDIVDVYTKDGYIIIVLDEGLM